MQHPPRALSAPGNLDEIDSLLSAANYMATAKADDGNSGSSNGI